MSEPIRLWDKSGTLWVTFSPSAARAAIEAGTHTLEQPVKPDDVADAPLDNWTSADPKDVRFVVTYTPDDTQDVPVVPTGRARRKGKGNGGVL